MKAGIQAVYQAPSRSIARDLAKGVVEDFVRELPSAVACFEDDFEACIAHLRMPVTHRRAIRTTDDIDKSFWASACYPRIAAGKGQRHMAPVARPRDMGRSVIGGSVFQREGMARTLHKLGATASLHGTRCRTAGAKGISLLRDNGSLSQGYPLLQLVP